MKSERLLDSHALVKYAHAEPGAERIERWFIEAKQSQIPLLVNELNLGEVFYVIARKKGLPKAEEFLNFLPGLPLRLIPATWEIILQAARLKAQYALSYADCVAAACAVVHQAVLVTGDPEFRALKHLVEIEWI